MKIKYIGYSTLVGMLSVGGILFFNNSDPTVLTTSEEIISAESGLISMHERLIDSEYYGKAHSTLNCAESIRSGQQYLDKFNTLEHLISLKKANTEIRTLKRYDVVDEKLMKEIDNF